MTTASKATRGRPARPARPVPERREFEGQDEVLGGMHPPAIKFENIGDVHTIKVEELDVEQDRDYKTGAPEFWPDGRPKLIMVLAGPCDDGEARSWYVRGRVLTKAVKDAIRAAGIRGIAEGDTVQVVRTDDVEVPPENGRGDSVWAFGYEVTITPATG